MENKYENVWFSAQFVLPPVLSCLPWFVCSVLHTLICLLSCGGAFFKISFCLGFALQALLKALV
jgi:hypothetical protein